MLLRLSDDQEFLPGDDGPFPDRAGVTGRGPALRHDAAGFDPAYWRRGAELGWTSLLVSEEHGGGTISGAGLVDLTSWPTRSAATGTGTARRDQRGRRDA